MEKPMPDEQRLERIMNGLGCSLATAKDVLRHDKIIDAGGDPFPQTPEQKAASKKYTTTGTKKPAVYKLEAREKKQNTTKREIITALAGFLAEYDNLDVVNPERIIQFRKDNKLYELTLTEKRKPK